MPAINRAWIEELAVSANSPGGLQIVREPEAASSPAPDESTHAK
jgi:hypothetical protein